MKRVFSAVKNNPLFEGIDPSDFERLLACLSAKTAVYAKDEIVLLAGGAVNSVGIVMSGCLCVVKEDIDGNTAIMTELAASEIFAESFACAGITRSTVTVLALEETEVLLMNAQKTIAVCPNACPFHIKLIENMLKLVAKKNLKLNRKLEVLAKRTTREKLLCFFDMRRGTAKKFTIPFNREELARYLCVDRSAMSSELGKMRKEGIINFRKNEFEIL